MTADLTALLDRLQTVDTPTVCNAIEVAQGRRGFDRFTRGTMVSASADRPVTGFARTARIAGAAPGDEPVDVLRKRRLEYFRSMADGRTPAVAVVEDMDYPNCVGAWWGEVHTAVHKGLGMVGAVTNGAVRDLDSLEPDFPVIAGSIGVSHAFVHVREIGAPVRILGLHVAEGDLVHADRHGALIVPPDVYGTLGDAIAKLHECEALVIDAAHEPGFDIDALEQAWAAFENARV